MKHGTRRRKSTKSNSKKISGRERRMLVQLAVSLLLFAVALVGRNVFPERMEHWNNFLHQNVDFQNAFSDFGEAALQGESLVDSLGELCVEVFAGGVKEVIEYAPIFQEPTSLFERCRIWGQEETLLSRKINGA